MKFLEVLQIVPNNLDLYIQAITHSSYAHENGTNDNERLEYLGDAVLELVTSEYLYHQAPSTEGEMTKLRSILVCTDALFNYATISGLEADLKLGVGEVKNPTNRKSIMADAMEAVIAAIYLDQGLAKVKAVIYKLFESADLKSYDYKSTLQELVQTDKKSVTYELIDESGPAHDKNFTVVVKIDNIIYGTGSASSKKEAEQLAAKVALNKQAK